MTEEKFRDFPIEKYQDRYLVSSLGKVLSKRTRKYLRKQVTNGFNIIFVNKLKSKRTEQFKVDEIIAKAFLEKKENCYLEHIDGNQLNDNISNLRWVNIQTYLKNVYQGNWLPIADYGDKYYISDEGKIWSSYTHKIIKQRIISGYMSVNIGYPKATFYHVHRLVASAFCDNKHNKPIVKHRDGNNLNNHANNLEWTSIANGASKYERRVSSEKVYMDPPKLAVVLDWLPDYLITSNGQIYSKKSNSYMKLHKNGSGYYRVYCMGTDKKQHNYYVHKLVAEAWLDDLPTPEQTQVNHKNLNRLDNRMENLEWCTGSENVQHSIINNSKQYKHLQKRVAQIELETGKVIKEFSGIKVASRETGANSGTIVKVCKNVRKSAGGFGWKYI